MAYSIESDIKEVHRALHATLTQSPKTAKKMLRAAVNAGRGEGKTRVYRSLKRGTGNLRQKVSAIMKSDYEGVVVVRSEYAANQIFGGEIIPKNREYFRFPIDGSFVTLDRIFIPPRWDFFGEMDRFFQSGAPLEKMEAVLEKELQRIWPS